MTSRPVTGPGHPGSVETGASWMIATIALGILALAYGGPLLSAFDRIRRRLTFAVEAPPGTGAFA